MRYSIVALLAVTLFCLLVHADENFCTGDFKKHDSICKKFDFDDKTDEEKCGSDEHSDDSSDDVDEDGIKLSNCTTFYDLSELPNQSIDNHTTKMAQLITNVFENGVTSIGYAYIEDIGDCRGYTSGYIGFTTGTNDAYMVVLQYLKQRPDSPLKKSLNELKKLSQYDFSDPRRASTKNLKKTQYAENWKKAACSDAAFVQTQLDIGRSMYLKPALKYAASVGVHSNLGKAIFYDTIIQHGWQYTEPQINLPRILQLTGRKRSNESEKQYLTRFLTTRRELACCSPSSVWNESASRMSDLQKLVDDWDRNKDLAQPVHLESFDVTVKGTEDLVSDRENCGKKKPKGRVQAKDLPIPDTCPNPLMS
ncbi:lysozyme-like domain-containing protein [Fennellomyces sp. T-0311]|nr:lysozyme-like domain-containing protein [Fennellomyces sp. T-0311]